MCQSVDNVTECSIIILFTITRVKLLNILGHEQMSNIRSINLTISTFEHSSSHPHPIIMAVNLDF